MQSPVLVTMSRQPRVSLSGPLVEVIRAGDDVQSAPQLQEEAPEQPQSPFILMVLIGFGWEKLSGGFGRCSRFGSWVRRGRGLSITGNPEKCPGLYNYESTLLRKGLPPDTPDTAGNDQTCANSASFG